MHANSYICDLAPYQPGLPIQQVARQYNLNETDIIKLASNENPLGPSPLAIRALQKTAYDSHRYPEQFPLVAALATHLGVSPDALVIGNGSNDILDIIARVYLGKNDHTVMSQYAFAMYHIAAQTVGATTIWVPAADYGHDLTAMRKAITSATKVVWIANPNNPTGTFLPYAAIEQFLQDIPPHVMVVLDEAYYEYLPQEHQATTAQWPQTYPNLIVVRTFSKIYGLAGLRVGYAVAAPQVAELLNRVRLPFTSNGPAIAAATAALQDTEFIKNSALANHQGRTQLRKELTALQLQCLPAFGNFVTVNVPDAPHVAQQLLARGIIVRPLQGYGMHEWLRISVGLPSEHKKLLTALKLVLTKP